MRVTQLLPRLLAVLGLALLLNACAHGGVVAAGDPAVAPDPAPAAVAQGGHDLITSSELDRVGANTLYEAVARLRPHFLKPRTGLTYGKAITAHLMLYVDGERMESVDDLRRVSLAEVHEVRFYEPQIANLRFARYNNAAGAIAVRLKQMVEVTP
jgi:hypothetical protein